MTILELAVINALEIMRDHKRFADAFLELSDQEFEELHSCLVKSIADDLASEG